MKDAVRQRARALGFDDCRVTTANAPESAAQFRRWLAEGRHGEMAWLERNAPKRVDPQQVLPGARSIIVLAASYHLANSKDTIPEPRQAAPRRGDVNRQSPIADSRCGLVARYARYTDYHDILGERLKELAAFVDERGGPGTRSLWYVDTGPLLERDFAQRAGVGFIGKHTNVISRRFGNWIFLAEIITTLELEPDAPEKNRCGSCTRCISACPTAAITAPFQLDARRCISYLTIELRGSIPPELRPAIGNRIFGCDDCLAVCPWNRFAREGQDDEGTRAAGAGAAGFAGVTGAGRGWVQTAFRRHADAAHAEARTAAQCVRGAGKCRRRAGLAGPAERGAGSRAAGG